MVTPLSFKEYVKYLDDNQSSKTKKKLNKKSSKGRYYGGVEGDQSGTVSETFHKNLPSWWSTALTELRKPEDEELEDDSEEDVAVDLDSEEELGADSEEQNDTEEMGEPDTGSDENEDPNRQGVIRVIDNAHLVYKRKDEQGQFEELWIYHVGGALKDELEIRRDILAGTDIPPGRTKSEDGFQHFSLWSVGNVQFLRITGLAQ